jgi:hypothetical protein
MLLDLLKDSEKRADRIELPTQLIIRDSCSSPRKNPLEQFDTTGTVKKYYSIGGVT